jgi:hypothetical protein
MTTPDPGTGGRGEPRRTFWYSHDLSIKNEPLIVSLVQYRQKKTRRRVTSMSEIPNLISSRTTDGRQMPIIDLDFSFRIEESSTPGHYHLYLDQPIGRVKFVILMLVLWWCRCVEMGYAVWSIRRMGNFVRLPGIEKQPGAESVYPEYGWFFKIKNRKHDA